MKQIHAVMVMLSLASIGCLALASAGCGHGQPAFAAAPPAGPNAHPAALLPPGKKHLLSTLTFYRQQKAPSGQTIASR